MFYVIARLMLYSVIARLGTSRGNLSLSVCHAERKRSIYGIAQQPNVSTLREILHYVQNDIVSVQNNAEYSADIVNAITNY